MGNKNESKPMTLRLPDGIRKRVERLALSKGTTPSGAARDLIEAALTRQDLTVVLNDLQNRIDASINLTLRSEYIMGIWVKSNLDPERREEIFSGLMLKAEQYADEHVEKVKKQA